MKATIAQFGLLVAALLLVGAGCLSTADQATETQEADMAAVDLSEVAVQEAGGLDAAANVLEGMIESTETDAEASEQEDDGQESGKESGEAAQEESNAESAAEAQTASAEENAEEQQQEVEVAETDTTDTQTVAEETNTAEANSETTETADTTESASPDSPAEEAATTTTTTQETAEQKTEENAEEVEAQKISVSVGVVSPTGSRSDYAVKIEEGGTVEDAMQKATNKGLSYGTRQFGGMGTYVESVNGTEEGGGLYWVFYINGTRAISGISTYKLNEGDEVLWKFRAPGAPD